MPRVLMGNYNAAVGAFGSVDYDYDYPEGLDLRPASELHKKLVTEILSRCDESRDEISKRYDSWNRMDRLMTTYIPPDEEEKEVQAGDERKPVSIVFPYSYTLMETMLTYLVVAFLQDPIFVYEGVSPEDDIGAILLQLVNQSHCNRFKAGLALHTFLRDGLIYGLGIVSPAWERRITQRSVKRPSRIEGALGDVIDMGYVRDIEERVVYEGNSLINIDPYRAFPDPNVSSHKIQDGEFFGYLSEDSYISLLREEAYGDSDLFNIKYLKHIKGYRSKFSEDESERETVHGVSLVGSSHRQTLHPIDVIWLYVDLIPEEWKLGDETEPEKWMFGLANDAVIVSAKPLGMNHQMFPICTNSPEFDGYSSVPLGRTEILYGLQHILDFMFSSHVTNVRKALNDMFVVDPFLVNVNDMKTPGPGKLIRLRRPAWGKGVERVVQQLQVNDITRANIGDSSWIMSQMQKASGADDSMMGSLRAGGPERLTSREFQGTRVGAIARMERVARVIGLQGMYDIGYMFAHNTQQFMTEETYVNIVGEWEEVLRKELNATGRKVKVTPWDILVDFDVMVKDGSIPGGNFSETWVELFRYIVADEELRAIFDAPRIFSYIARNMGAKNVHEFVRTKPRVMGDEEVLKEAEKGNLVPMEEG